MKVNILDNQAFETREYTNVTQVSINVMPRVKELDMEEQTLISIVRNTGTVRLDLTKGAIINIVEDK